MNRSDHDDRDNGESDVQATDQPTSPDAPFVAKLVSPTDDAAPAAAAGRSAASDEVVRVGSPFRTDPTEIRSAPLPVFTAPASGEAAYADFGPFLYTAMGASTAAVLVLFFASAGAWWFPTGGALVAVLGTVLSIVGLFSTRRFRYAAIAVLPLHMVLFFFSYVRSLG